mmetsp:Transcript_20108/g.17807  ORF Transcript_20108/g.17807 Transcript_20108/m.17807 type:complete len:81 (-) Transcript_20108:515-757(-)
MNKINSKLRNYLPKSPLNASLINKREETPQPTTHNLLLNLNEISPIKPQNLHLKTQKNIVNYAKFPKSHNYGKSKLSEFR